MDQVLLDRDDQDLTRFFRSYQIVRKLKWRKAYPNFDLASSLVGKARFVLAEGVYFANALESAASSLEMASVGARNVARLLFDKFYGDNNVW